MPIKLRDLERDARTVVVTWGEEEASVSYRPSGYTPATEQELNLDMNASLPNVAVAKMLASMLVSWDVLGEDGKPIPTDLETLKHIQTDFLQAVLSVITSDQAANREDRKNSGGGSLRKAK